MNPATKLPAEFGFLDFALFQIAGVTVTVATLIVFALIILVTVAVSRLIQVGVRHAFHRRGISPDDGGLTATLRLLNYGILAVGLGVALETIGINLSALFAAGAIFAVAIGFAMQNIVQNFVSGVILLFERSIKSGDVLRVESHVVRVEKIGIRSTVVRTLDDEELILPNSMLVQSAVTNFTLRDSVYRLRAPVGVVYGSDMTRVREVLERAAAELPWRLQERRPVVYLTQFGGSSVDFEVSVWMNDPWRMRRARSRLNETIWQALKEAGITIAFPQLDVHFDPGLSESLSRFGAGLTEGAASEEEPPAI